MSYKKPFSAFIAMLLLASMILVFVGRQIPKVSAPTATGLPTDWPSVFFCGDTLGFCNGSNAIVANVGDTFNVALVVFNLTSYETPDPSNPLVKRPLGNLTGFDVQLAWNRDVLNLTSYTITTPWNDFQNPVPPSPYPGVLYAPTFELNKIVNESDSIPDSEPGTMAWFAYSSMDFTTHFNGNATFFTMTFNVKSVGSSLLKLISVALSDHVGHKLLWHQYDGYFHTPGAPVADFSYWPDVAVVNKTVIFNASASYSPLNLTIASYNWDFGDGNITTVTDPIVYHTYAARRTATVTLTVADGNGVGSSPKTDGVSVVNNRNVRVTSVNIGAINLVVNRTANVDVTVYNDGDAAENCTTTAYYNTTAVDFNSVYATNWTEIDEGNVVLTTTQRAKDMPFLWNTTGIPVVNASYYVMANMTFVPYESDTSNNVMVSANPVYITDTAIHDVSIEQVQFGWEAQGVFEHPALQGETSKAMVVARNRGTENETNVNVLLYRNGTVWGNLTQALPFGARVALNVSEQLSVGSYNLTAQAAIPVDVSTANNRLESVLRVIAPPVLNFSYTPKPPIVNGTTTFDASPSIYGESDANITGYSWEFWAPDTASPTSTAHDKTSGYRFTSRGVWRVILTVTDSFGMTFRTYRPATQAYQLVTAVTVQAETPPGGLPIEYLLAVVIIVVVIAALAVVLIRRRRARKT
jgi:PKD repeat protein